MDRLPHATRNLLMGIRGLALLATFAVALGTATIGASTPGSRLASFRPAPGCLVEHAGAANPSLVVAVTTPDASAVHPVALFLSGLA
jgi:hypothetical protein